MFNLYDRYFLLFRLILNSAKMHWANWSCNTPIKVKYIPSLRYFLLFLSISDQTGAHSVHDQLRYVLHTQLAEYVPAVGGDGVIAQV